MFHRIEALPLYLYHQLFVVCDDRSVGRVQLVEGFLGSMPPVIAPFPDIPRKELHTHPHLILPFSLSSTGQRSKSDEGHERSNESMHVLGG